jgi:hypothetical protein
MTVIPGIFRYIEQPAESAKSSGRARGRCLCHRQETREGEDGMTTSIISTGKRITRARLSARAVSAAKSAAVGPHVRVAMVAVLLALCATVAVAQNTMVTIEGTITNAGTVPGISVGDRYAMQVSYNPTQAPTSNSFPGESYYTGYTLNATVYDKNGNQSFTADPDEQLFVQATDPYNFISLPCCTSTGAGFVLENSSVAFKNSALPTALTLANFNDTYTVFGNSAFGNITSVKVVNAPGAIPAFISVGNIDPNGKVPTYNGVPGAGVTNLDIAFPLTGITHGNAYVYTLAMQVINFTGSCTASFALTQEQLGKTVTLDSGSTKSFSCAPSDIYYWVFNGKTLPNSPGPATLTGTVTYGSSKATTSTTLTLQ